EQAFAGRANPRSRHLPGLDAIPDAPRVRPHRTGVEHAGEPVRGEGVPELPVQLRWRDRFRPRPHPLEEMNVAVPETGGDGAARAVDPLYSGWNRRMTDRLDDAVSHQHRAVADDLVARAGMDGPAHQSQISHGRSLHRRVLMTRPRENASATRRSGIESLDGLHPERTAARRAAGGRLVGRARFRRAAREARSGRAGGLAA